MTVGELKKILADVRDDMEVWGYDEGCLTDEVCPSTHWIKCYEGYKAAETWNPNKPGCAPWTEEDGATEVFLL